MENQEKTGVTDTSSERKVQDISVAKSSDIFQVKLYCAWSKHFPCSHQLPGLSESLLGNASLPQFETKLTLDDLHWPQLLSQPSLFALSSNTSLCLPQNVRCAPTSGSLHLLNLLPGTLFHETSMWIIPPLSQPGLLDPTSFKIAIPPPDTYEWCAHMPKCMAYLTVFLPITFKLQEQGFHMRRCSQVCDIYAYLQKLLTSFLLMTDFPGPRQGGNNE